MAIIPTGCQERFLIWGSSGGSLYKATGGYVAQEEQNLSSQEGHI